MLKLYLAAHDAAVKTLDKKSKEELDAAKLEAFKAAGLNNKQDFHTFGVFFDDERLKMLGFTARKTAAETAADVIA